MKTQRAFPKFTITQKGTRWVENGHPWIYEAEILSEEGNAENGALVDAVSEKGKYLGTGFLSRNSKIRIRLVSRNANDRFDDAFWRRRVQYAWDYRKAVMGEDVSACRVIFGEADAFPGLTVDRFNDVLVAQTLSIGIERIKPVLFPIIVDVLNADGAGIKGIYERNDVAIRALEGMEQGKGWYLRKEDVSPETVITENGIKYRVDLENGQKTGFFLDQKYNRRAIASYAKGRTVIDCCTHTGSFALNCAKNSAASVTAVDVSSAAIDMTRENSSLNGIQLNTEVSDVFDFLKNRIDSHDKSADLIILDPPAFTKSRKTLGNARNGYTELNTLGMRLLPRGGILATASCSHFFTADMFREMLLSSARAANVNVRIIEERRQSPDHPVLLGVEQTEYLKFFILQIV